MQVKLHNSGNAHFFGPSAPLEQQFSNMSDGAMGYLLSTIFYLFLHMALFFCWETHAIRIILEHSTISTNLNTL